MIALFIPQTKSFNFSTIILSKMESFAVQLHVISEKCGTKIRIRGKIKLMVQRRNNLIDCCCVCVSGRRIELSCGGRDGRGLLEQRKKPTLELAEHRFQW